MDRTEPAAPEEGAGPAEAAAAPAPPGKKNRPAGSQTRIPAVLLWILAAAVVLRIVTAIADRGKRDEGAGLVRWQARESALALSSAWKRPVLYDFTAAWCPPCHRLDKEGWADQRIAAGVGQAFVPTRIVDRQREDGKNPPDIEALQQRYKIDVFPTLIVADASGREIARMPGYANKAQLEAFLKDASEKARK